MNFLKRTYNWTLEKAQHKNAKWYLSLISFAESSFFPIPPDILLIPMALASKARALFYAFMCTLFSVLGGILGYAIGYFFYNSVGIYIVDFYHLDPEKVLKAREFAGYYLGQVFPFGNKHIPVIHEAFVFPEVFSDLLCLES